MGGHDMMTYRKALKEHYAEIAKRLADGAPKAIEDNQATSIVKTVDRKTNFEAILNEVAHKHNLPPESVMSNRRYGFIVKAKRELSYLIRQRLKWSLPTIAQFTGTHYTAVRHNIMQHCLANDLPLPDGINWGRRERSNTLRRLKEKP